MMKNWCRALIIQIILLCIYQSVNSISTTYTTYLEGHIDTTTGSYSTVDDQFVPAKPTNLSVLEVTSTTIKIKWHEPENADGVLAGYTVYYFHKNQTHNQTTRTSDTRTSPTVQFVLPNLKPYSEYRIYVKAFTQFNVESEASEVISQKTDISGPSPPIVVNLTCHSHDTIFLRSKRPLEFYRSIDFYTIAYRRLDQHAFQEIIINTSAIHLELAMKIDDLTTNFIYEVKVCASPISAIHPNHIINGSFSEPKKLNLSQFTRKKVLKRDSLAMILMQPNCEKIQPLLRQSQDDYSATMLVGIILSCLGVILCILAFVLWRKCFQAAYYYLDDAPGQAQTSLLIDWEAPVDLGGEVRAAVPVSEFAKHVAQLHADGDIGYSKEYEALQNESIVEEHPSEQSQHPDNKTKNRYLNIIAYDHTRVLLRTIPGQKKTFDYINANFIDGYKKSRAFIATQGPLPGTFDSFWSMIWEQRVAIIVMITNLVERGRRKCDMYWPKVGTETYGVIQVRFIQEEVMATYTVRTFQMKHLKIKKKKHVAEKLVYQYHYTNWPDHGTPDHPLPVLNFVKKSADANPRDAGPIVVHCPAGVGRTGTYIVLDAMLKQIEHKNVVNVFGFLRHIRAQRNFLVQTEEQYIFIHDALLEAIVSGDTNVKADVVMDLKDDKETLAQQFKLITQFKAKDVQMASAIKPVNLVKNRSTLVPLEGFRVHLTPKPGEEGSDYINASWFQGFRRLRDFIVTQHPMESTIKDFWQMIWDHNAQTIVLLSPTDDPNLPQFCPDDSKKIDSDHYRINFVSKINKCDYISRDFTMQSIQDDYELSVRMLHCSRWPELGHPASIFDFIVDVHQRGNEYKNGPIVVIDPNGGTQACVFCVITSQAMQMEYNNTTNVYTYAKLYHNKRPGVWNSVDDLKQIYNLLSSLPSDLSLLKFTEIRSEFEDVTTAAPDLYSKVTSNGNISSSLINTTNGTAIINGNSENDEFSVVVTESDNIEV